MHLNHCFLVGNFPTSLLRIIVDVDDSVKVRRIWISSTSRVGREIVLDSTRLGFEQSVEVGNNRLSLADSTCRFTVILVLVTVVCEDEKRERTHEELREPRQIEGLRAQKHSSRGSLHCPCACRQAQDRV